VSLVEATTQVVAQALAAEGHAVGVLNFASAREVGGGFLTGSASQEEDLCRCSGLYRCLEAAPAYYALHGEVTNALYGDHAALSPGVPFFRTADDQPNLAAPFLATVVTMAAPNARLLAMGGEAGLDLQGPLERRVRGMLALFRSAGIRQLVLGAWGCGDFTSATIPARSARSSARRWPTPRSAARSIGWCSPSTTPAPGSLRGTRSGGFSGSESSVRGRRRRGRGVRLAQLAA
jgi:uncharacterized protein (TIGR02452 family)